MASVLTSPGRTAFTRILSGASSMAAPRTRPSTPDFDVLYSVRNGHGILAASDEMHTIDPPPPWAMSGVAWRITMNAETMLLVHLLEHLGGLEHQQRLHVPAAEHRHRDAEAVGQPGGSVERALQLVGVEGVADRVLDLRVGPRELLDLACGSGPAWPRCDP